MATYHDLRQPREHGPKDGHACQNVSGDELPKHRLCKYVSGTRQGVELASSPDDLFAGVTSFAVPGETWAALRVGGVTVAEAGAQVIEGDRVTAGADGKLVPAGSGEAWMGIAVTSAAADGDLFEVELRLSGGGVLP